CESVRDESVLLFASADGAGSARFAEVGASLACEIVLGRALADLRDGLTVAGIERDTVRYWLEEGRNALKLEAERSQTTPPELACTLLLGVVGEQAAAVAQIGDGAIGTRVGGGYPPRLWP